jgi:hypothetical protein
MISNQYRTQRKFLETGHKQMVIMALEEILEETSWEKFKTSHITIFFENGPPDGCVKAVISDNYKREDPVPYTVEILFARTHERTI